MRLLIVLGLITAGFAMPAQAHKSGAKSKSQGFVKSFRKRAQPNRLGRRSYFQSDRRSARGSHYQYSDYPVWAARALQPRSTGR